MLTAPFGHWLLFHSDNDNHRIAGLFNLNSAIEVERLEHVGDSPENVARAIDSGGIDLSFNLLESVDEVALII